MKLTRCILLIAAVLILSSCKIRIVVPEGGSVTTQSGAYSCASGKTCNIDVVDFYFDQKFIAKPASGYKFKFWKKADRRFCGQDTKPCRVTTAGTNGNKDLAKVMMSFFESNEVFYLQPVFEKAGSNSTSCSVYAGDTGMCAEGTYPNCSVPDQLAYQVTSGMTYPEVVELFGCHGKLLSASIGGGGYQWGAGSQYAPPDVMVVFWPGPFRGSEMVVSQVTVF